MNYKNQHPRDQFMPLIILFFWLFTQTSWWFFKSLYEQYIEMRGPKDSSLLVLTTYDMSLQNM